MIQLIRGWVGSIRGSDMAAQQAEAPSVVSGIVAWSLSSEKGPPLTCEYHEIVLELWGLGRER